VSFVIMKDYNLALDLSTNGLGDKAEAQEVGYRIDYAWAPNEISQGGEK